MMTRRTHADASPAPSLPRRIGLAFGAICCRHGHEIQVEWGDTRIVRCHHREPSGARAECGAATYALRLAADRAGWLAVDVTEREALVITEMGYGPERAARYLGIEMAPAA